MKIEQAYVSPTLERNFGHGFRKRWDLRKYDDFDQPAVFFGLYSSADIEAIISHKSFSIVVWGGADMRGEALKTVSQLVKSNRAATWCYPGEFSKVLSSNNIPHKQLYVQVKDYSDFQLEPLGDKIYVYRGINGNRADYFKWREVIFPLMKTIGESNFIYAEGLGLNELITDCYRKCFVYVKPTAKGGCTAMFELGHMGRRTIGVGHANLPNFIEYTNPSDLANLIKIESKNIGKTVSEVREATQSIFTGQEWLETDFWKTNKL